MKTPIVLESNPGLVRRYRDVLTQDWTEATLAQTLELLTAQLPAEERSRFISITDPFKTIRLFSKVLAIPVKMSTAQPPRRSRKHDDSGKQTLVDSVERSLAFMLFQLSYAIDEKCELFIDSQSLLYLCVIHFLLPALDSRQMTTERNSLVSALAIHSLTWESNLPHMLYLKSLLFHYLNQTSRETDALVESFKLTDPDDHDYVTKAQAAWMSMLDDHQVGRAKEFMLEVYRNCPQNARAEVREIIDETYALADKGSSLRKTS
ncbi:MAG TPA: hypothetical protein VHY91_01500 [Pirellulales bacterium]|jgi:hypothetical protein|nr:hypothetical protein [Pirellulales bacterium]